jgi:hypothetical protein
MSNKTKVICLKKTKSKKGIYKDILNDSEKVKNILKRKKTIKNYDYLNSNILFDKKNNILSSNSIIKPKTDNKLIKKTSVLKPPINNNLIKNINNRKLVGNNKKNIPSKVKKMTNINISQTKKNVKKNKNIKSKRIDDFFKKPKKLTPRTNSIKKKVLNLLSDILKQKSNSKLIKFISKLNLPSLKIIAVNLNLVENINKLKAKMLKNMIYMSLSDNIIIYKIN